MAFNSANHFQVLVIGSGPAGGRAAHFLAQSNIRTAILEKSSLPRKKVCAGGITWRGMTFLPDGLSSVIEGECVAVDLFIHDIPKLFRSRYPKPVIAMVQRNRFDFALTSKAVEAGAYLFDRTCVQYLRPHPNRVEVVTDRDLFSADFVILADGAHSPLAKSMNWPDHRKLVPAIEVEIEFKRKDNTARFDFGFCKRGYGWVFPKKDRLSIGMLSMNGKSLRSDFLKYLRHIGLKPSMSPLKGHPIPMSPRKAPFIRGRVLLVGDSAGFVDPVTGEGISYALKSGLLAGRALQEGYPNPNSVATIYKNQIEFEILRELRIGSFLAKFIYGPRWLRSATFKWFGPSICRAMCSIVNGDQTYFDLVTNHRNYGYLISRFISNRFRSLRKNGFQKNL